MLGGRCLNNCLFLRTSHVRKLLFLTAFRKVLGVEMKQHQWRYWISSVVVLSFVTISIAWCLTGISMGVSHRPSILFLCPFKISFLPLKILIPLLSKMATQSSSHSWPEDISEALCNPSKVCAFFAWALRLISCGMFPVLVALIVSLFGNWTVGPSLVFLHFYLTRHCQILQLYLCVVVGLQ